MSKNFPKFWIYAVVDGESQGLYVKKQKSENVTLQKIYFYLPNGLRPTEEIRKASKYNTKSLYREDDREERILNEIISYAVNVELHGKRGKFEFMQKYAESRGYQEVVDRYYEDDRKSPFKEFFDSAATLKKHVLRNVRGKHNLAEGMAEEFKVLSPHQITIDDFEYLEPISDVLKIGITTPQRCLLKAGPIAADFDSKIYTRKKLLEDLKRLVSKNTVSMLVGKAATGKTVLVRQLGYKLYTKDNWAVYYFDCDGERDFDWRKLTKEINSVRGIFLLENIHLAVQKFQRIHDRIKNDPRRHVLLITRPSFRESQSQKYVDLGEIESVELMMFDEVDKIIDHFASRHEEVTWPKEVRESIKNISKKSFWLLSYALEGCVKAKGKGEPRSWIKVGVREDLEEQEKINTNYPEVLVSLAPLFMNEVLTDELYLTKILGFDQQILNNLVYTGEITKQQGQDNHIFYGLPHSALADAYWEHGDTYKRRRGLTEYKDFLYKYTISVALNGLEAVLRMNRQERQTTLVKLEKDDRMAEVIAKEKSMELVSEWADQSPFQGKVSNKLLMVLAKRIEDDENLDEVGWCYWRAVEMLGWRLWKVLDHVKLARKLSNIKDNGGVTAIFNILFLTRTHVGKEETIKFCKSMNMGQLAESVIKPAVINRACDVVYYISLIAPEVGDEFWQLINLEKIANNLNEFEDVYQIGNWFKTIFGARKEDGLALWKLFNQEKLAQQLSCSEPIGSVGLCIHSIYKAHAKACQQLWHLLDQQRLADRLVNADDINQVALCLDRLCDADDTIFRDLCAKIDLTQFALKLSRIGSPQHLVAVESCIRCIMSVAPQTACKLCSLLEVEKMANNPKLWEKECFGVSFLSIVQIANPVVAKKLKQFLDKDANRKK